MSAAPCPWCGRGFKPLDITHVRVTDKVLADSVNRWNARWPVIQTQSAEIRARLAKDFDGKLVSQVAAAGVIRYRWSWWRFTLTVRR